MEPKILSSGEFSPDDISISISPSNRIIDKKIEDEIEKVWTRMMMRAKEKGLNLYNGISYRLNSLEQKGNILKIDLSTFEYKIRDGLIAIPEYFNLPEEYWRKGCFTAATVKTSDWKYLMVELSGKSMNTNTIDLLGGVIEFPPEIKTGGDIFKSLYSELEEEAFVNRIDIEECFLKTIFLERRHNIGFYFEVILNISSKKLIERYTKSNMDVDIKSVKFFGRDEYLKTLCKHNPNKQLIAKLVEI